MFKPFHIMRLFNILERTNRSSACTNKLLKSDSQRVAFLLCGGLWWLRRRAVAFVLRYSHLSKALEPGWESQAKISELILFLALLFTWTSVPFTFFPVALYAKCSLWFHRLRLLTLSLFLWRFFIIVVAFERTLITFGVAVEVRGKNPFLIWSRSK